jgi:hypothetical protein
MFWSFLPRAKGSGALTKAFADTPGQVAGYVTIKPTRFWLLFVDATRKTPAPPTLTDAEAVAMMKTEVAWTDKYTTGEQTADGIKLTAHVNAASSQAIFDTDLVHFIPVDGNKMMVQGNVIVPMTGHNAYLNVTAHARPRGADLTEPPLRRNR